MSLTKRDLGPMYEKKGRSCCLCGRSSERISGGYCTSDGRAVFQNCYERLAG